MPKLTRRSLFPLAAAGIIPAADGSQGATLDPNGLPGILVRIAYIGWEGGWCALVPDLDAMHGYWKPGMVVPTKWMPINEYLTMIDKAYSMEDKPNA